MRFFEPFAFFRRAIGAAELSPVSFDATSECGRSGQSPEPSRKLPVARRAALRSSVPLVYRPAAPESVEWGGHPSVPPVTEVADGGPNRVSGRNTDRNR
jgi:hypothetical protein